MAYFFSYYKNTSGIKGYEVLMPFGLLYIYEKKTSGIKGYEVNAFWLTVIFLHEESPLFNCIHILIENVERSRRNIINLILVPSYLYSGLQMALGKMASSCF